MSSAEPRQIQTKWFHEFANGLPSLQGKTIAITGCTSGTGFIVARTAILKGADHVLLLNVGGAIVGSFDFVQLLFGTIRSFRFAIEE